MTKAKIEPDRIITNFLRANLSDPNSSRSGQWIYPDFPRVESLGDASFPRIGITILSESSNMMGIYDDNQYEKLIVQIDIVAKKGNGHSVTTTDEAMGTMSSGVNSNRMTFEYVPNSVTNVKHTITSFGTVTGVATNSAFTTPSAGIVEWSISTGDLNFAAADIVSYDTEAITSTSITYLEGKKLCQYLAREIIKVFRTQWRTDTTINGLRHPTKINNIPIPFDEDLGLFRQTLEYEFDAFNIGEGL